jgi:hypothetical protein|tara:strand:- start:383 stop:970 length:588 start_codon:yes stop_codon:yes gene_type:complete
MSDALLNTSIAAIVSNATSSIPSASTDELLKIATAIQAVGKGEDTTLETAINSRVNTLMAGSPSISDVEKLGRVLRKMRSPTTVNLVGNTDNLPEGSGNLYHTDSRADSRADGRISASSLSSLADVHTTVATDGQVLKWDNANTRWEPGTVGGVSVTVSTTAPSSPNNGDFWFDSVNGSLLINYNDGSGSQWVAV